MGPVWDMTFPCGSRILKKKKQPEKLTNAHKRTAQELKEFAFRVTHKWSVLRTDYKTNYGESGEDIPKEKENHFAEDLESS